jgi:hypothetical protein
MYEAYTERRKGAFVFNDPVQAKKGEPYQKVVAWHTASRNKVIDNSIQPATHGRSSKVKHALKNTSSRRLSRVAIIPVICKTPDGCKTVERVFFNSVKSYKKALQSGAVGDDLYLKRGFKRVDSSYGIYAKC